MEYFKRLEVGMTFGFLQGLNKLEQPPASASETRLGTSITCIPPRDPETWAQPTPNTIRITNEAGVSVFLGASVMMPGVPMGR